MNEEIIREVLEETLHEMQKVNEEAAGMKAKLASLEGKFAVFEQLLRDQRIIIPPVDLGPAVEVFRAEAAEQRQESANWIELVKEEMEKEVAAARATTVNVGQKVEEGIRLINTTVAAQPKPIVRQLRLVLFPGNDVEEAYKALAKMLAVIILFGMAAVGLYWAVEAIRSDFASVPVVSRQPTAEAPAKGMDMHTDTIRVHRTPGLPANRKHGLTAEEARRQLNSMILRQKIMRKIDTLEARIKLEYGDSLPK